MGVVFINDSIDNIEELSIDKKLEWLKNNISYKRYKRIIDNVCGFILVVTRMRDEKQNPKTKRQD